LKPLHRIDNAIGQHSLLLMRQVKCSTCYDTEYRNCQIKEEERKACHIELCLKVSYQATTYRLLDSIRQHDECRIGKETTTLTEEKAFQG